MKFLLFLLIFSLSHQIAVSQDVSINDFKAVFLFKFTKFIDWPEQHSANNDKNINICILEDDSVYNSLKVFKGKKVRNKRVKVLKKYNENSLNSCHVLFIGSSNLRRQKAITDRLKGTSVLTISHSEKFIENGGMINFLIEKDKLNFEINNKVVRRANIRISSSMLMLAKKVVE